MLDGASRIGEVVAAAAADGQPAVGITDHGNMYGVLPLYEAARDAGIKPVLGMEGYFTNTSRFDRPKRSEHEIFHLTMLAETNEGYRNLIKVTSAAYLDGYYYKPRSDWELLERHHEGISATTGCLGGLVSQLILKDEHDAALEAAARFQDIFGREHFFVELQDHGIDDDARVIRPLLDIARKLRAPLLATNDSHYTHKEDAEAHDALLCVQTGALQSDPEALQVRRQRLLHQERGRDARAVRRSSRRVRQHAADRGARRRRDRVRPGDPSRVPGSRRSRRELVPARAHDAGREGALRTEHRRRTSSSASSSSSTSSSRWGSPRTSSSSGTSCATRSRANIRVGPGRGSAAGSCVAFCLRIVDIDPIKYDLLFERFLNPGRKQMPDIDMDFDSRYRGEMIKYAAQKYGHDHVAQIITFSTIKARAAVRDARAGARLPVRGRRQDRQAHAAAHHGPRHAAARVPRHRTSSTPTATRWPPTCARCTTSIPTPSASSTSPAGSKGCAARTASTRPRWSSPANRSPSTCRSSASPSPAPRSKTRRW